MNAKFMELGAHLGKRQRIVSKHVDEAAFLRVELPKLISHAGSDCLEVLLLTTHSRGESTDDVGFESGIKEERSIGVGDAILDNICRNVRKIAVAVLACPAEEVLVDSVATPFDLGVDDPACLTALIAVQTEDHALEHMVVDAVALPCPAPCRHDLLHPVE
ncbi:hypothetical protein [Sinomonas albida]|uniref:hypothetical protein n=1 Tax=Sinomonas albida TaxID=369942 RepID=UPI0030193BE1